jgi:cytidine deaminase
MDNLTNTLILKRLNLNPNCDCNRLHVDETYRHAAAIFCGTTYPLKILSYGINNHSIPSKFQKTTHAEVDAINKLKPRTKTNNIKSVNIYIIKTSKTGKLGNSKPCFNCMLNMVELPPKKGYKIEWVYFSTKNGTIDKYKLSQLFEMGNYHVSSFYRNINYKHALLKV